MQYIMCVPLLFLWFKLIYVIVMHLVGTYEYNVLKYSNDMRLI